MKPFISKLQATIGLFIVALILPPIKDCFAQNKSLPAKHIHALTKSSASSYPATLLNINNLSMWVRADGLSANNPYTGESGVIYPHGTAGVIFYDGILWGGYVYDGQKPELRAGGQKYGVGTVPGRIISPGVAENPNSPEVRIWRIRRDFQTADLAAEAIDVFKALPRPHPIAADSLAALAKIADSLRIAYAKDWREWPWQKGAPFYDTNQNGLMDASEAPGLFDADQVIWFVANDLDAKVVNSLMGSPPIGLEFRTTLWAYQRDNLFDNIIFKKYELLYKGTATTTTDARIDSLYFGQWSDPDLGDFNDDLVGCDSTLHSGFVYNSSNRDKIFELFKLPVPAVGYAILSDKVLGKTTELHERGLSGFTYSAFAGGGIEPCYAVGQHSYTIYHYQTLAGYYSRCDLRYYFLVRDYDGTRTNFLLSGDPVARTGRIDGYFPPGDRRILLGSGPFFLHRGDTLSFVIALVGGMGTDHRGNVNVVKHYIRWAHTLAQSNFDIASLPLPEKPRVDASLPKGYSFSPIYPNPFSIPNNRHTTIHYQLPRESEVELKIYDVLGHEIQTLIQRAQLPGDYVITWDGTTAAGAPVMSGIYFVHLRAWVFEKTRKILVVR